MLIYVITDRHLRPDLETGRLVEYVRASGADMIQIREKDLGAADLLRCARRGRAPREVGGPEVYVNGRVDVALAVGADGVHLPSAGLPAVEVRRCWGGRLRIGVSAHSVDETRIAEAGGADFVTFGPVFDTPSKRRYGSPVGVGALREAVGAVRIPVLAIGGIDPETLPLLAGTGISGIAVISAVILAGDMRRAVADLRRAADGSGMDRSGHAP